MTAPGTSSSYHKVRITTTTGNAAGGYVDVTVLDAVAFIGTDGQEYLLNVAAANAQPGNSRRSHTIDVYDPADSTRHLQYEVLDAVSVTGTDGQEYPLIMRAPNASVYPTPQTDPVTGGDLVATEAQIVTGKSQASRLEAISTISDSSPGFPAQNADGSWPPYILSSYPTGLCIIGTDGQEVLLNRQTGGPSQDTTQYVTDPGTGLPAPPPNTDPNTYVTIPDDTSAIGTGSALISQGLLWQITAIHSPTPLYLIVWALGATQSSVPAPFPPFIDVPTLDTNVNTPQLTVIDTMQLQLGVTVPFPPDPDLQDSYTAFVALFKIPNGISGPLLRLSTSPAELEALSLSAILFSWTPGQQQNGPDLSGVDLAAIITQLAHTGRSPAYPFPYSTAQAAQIANRSNYAASSGTATLSGTLSGSSVSDIAWSS